MINRTTSKKSRIRKVAGIKYKLMQVTVPKYVIYLEAILSMCISAKKDTYALFDDLFDLFRIHIPCSSGLIKYQ